MKAKKGKKAQRRKMHRMAMQAKKPAKQAKKPKRGPRNVGWTTLSQLSAKGRRPSDRPKVERLGDMVTDIPGSVGGSLRAFKSVLCKHDGDGREFTEDPFRHTVANEVVCLLGCSQPEVVDDDCDELDDKKIARLEAKLKGMSALAIRVLGQEKYAELVGLFERAHQGSVVAKAVIKGGGRIPIASDVDPEVAYYDVRHSLDYAMRVA